MAELKPCPFCGSEKVGSAKGNCYWVDEEYRDNIRVIGCKKCGAIAGIFNVRALGEKKAKEKAIESWNRRISDGNII